MPRANIYIRPENEAFWKTLKNKSKHINDFLAMQNGKPSTPEVEKVIRKDTCKHGNNPQLCKFFECRKT